MGMEIEAKMKVDDTESVRLRLEASGAVPAGEHLEVNTFFDTTAGSLRVADKGLRLRENKDVKTGKTVYIVTYKGPRQPGPLKTREEIEITVDDPHAATAMFQALGYALVLSFQKRRRSWQLLGCKVELDELPYLGTFVEVEGPSADKVMHVRDTLGLADQPIVKTGYISLLITHLEEHKIQTKSVEFPPA